MLDKLDYYIENTDIENTAGTKRKRQEIEKWLKDKEKQYNFIIGERGFGKTFYQTQMAYSLICKYINIYRYQGIEPKYIVMNSYTLMKIKQYLNDYMIHSSNMGEIIENKIAGIKILTDDTMANFTADMLKELK